MRSRVGNLAGRRLRRKVVPAVGFVASLALLLVSFVSISTPVQAAINNRCDGSSTQNNLTVSASHGSVFYIDSSSGQQVDASYAAYKITNTSGSAKSDLWARIDGFTGGVVKLSNPLDENAPIGEIAGGSASKTAFFFLKASGSTSTAQSHIVHVYEGKPGTALATEVYSCSFTFVKVAETIKAKANKVTNISATSTSVLGSEMTVTVTGNTGTVGAGSATDPSIFWVSPAARSTWPSQALRLESTSIGVYSDAAMSTPIAGSPFTDVLKIPITAGSKYYYSAVYTFRIVGQSAIASTSVFPISQIASGTQTKHTDLSALPSGGNTTTLSLAAPTTSVTVSKSLASAVEVTPTQSILTYTVTLTNTGAATSVDQVVDTPDSKLHFVSGSATVNGVPWSDGAQPTSAPTTLVFSGPIDVAAGSSGTPSVTRLTYKMSLDACSGTYSLSNSAVATIGATTVGSGPNTYSLNSAGGTCGQTTLTSNSTTNATLPIEAITSPASNVATTTATLNGVIDPNGTSGRAVTFKWGTSSTLASSTTVTLSNTTSSTSPYAVSTNLTGLTAGTTYYFQVNAGTVSGEILSFTTPEVVGTPVALTQAATGIDINGNVTLNGSIDPNQVANGTQVKFKYAEDTGVTKGLCSAQGTATTTAFLQEEDANGSLINMNLTGAYPSDVSLATTIALGSPAKEYFCYQVIAYTGSPAYSTVASTGAWVSIRFKQVFPQVISFTTSESYALGSSPSMGATTDATGLAVTYTSNSPDVCTVDALGVVTTVKVGVCSITASQSGNSDYSAAAPVTNSFYVRTGQTITFAQPADQVIGATLSAGATADSQLAVTYSSSTPDVCTVDGETGLITTVGAGSCTITASQPGNAMYSAATDVARTFTVAKKSQTITFDALTGKVIDDTVSIAPTSSSGLPVTYSSSTPLVCSVDENGVITALAAGTCSVTASQSGDDTYAAATDVVRTFTVAKKPQTITFTEITDILTSEETVAVASASSTLTVTYSSDTPLVCSVDAITGQITPVDTGLCLITASQSGDDTFLPATEVSESFRIRAPQSITVTPTASTLSTSESLTITSSSTSGLTVTYSTSTPDVCHVDADGTVTGLNPGECIVIAQQAGDLEFGPAPESLISIVITSGNPVVLPEEFTITFGDDLSTTLTAGGGFGEGTFGNWRFESAPPSWATLDAETGALASNVKLNVGDYTIQVRVDSTSGATVAESPVKSIVVHVIKRTVHVQYPVTSVEYGSSLSLTLDPIVDTSEFVDADPNPTITNATTSEDCSTTYVVGDGVSSEKRITCVTSAMTSDNYVFVDVPRNVIVTPKTVRVQYPVVTVQYGDALAELGSPYFTAGDFVEGDDESVVSGTAGCTSDYVVGDSVNSDRSVTCDVSGLHADNYSFEATPRSVTITKRPLFVNGPDETVVFGQELGELGVGSFDGFVGEDDESVIDGVATACTSDYEVGDPVVTDEAFKSLTTCTGEGLSATNYDVVTGAHGRVTVTKKPIDVAHPELSVVFGDDLPTFSDPVIDVTQYEPADASPVVSGSATCTSDYVVGDAVALSETRSVSCDTTGMTATNYSFVDQPRSIVITKRPVGINYPVTEVVYGEPLVVDANQVVLDSADLVAADPTPTVEGQAECSTDYSVGDSVTANRSVTCDPGTLLADNYSFTGGQGAINITKRTVRLTTEPDVSVEFGSGLLTLDFGFVEDDFVSPDTASVVSGEALCQSEDYAPGSPAGQAYSFECVPHTLTATNYQFVAASGTVTVTKKPVGVRYPNPVSVEYGSELPTLSDGTVVTGDLDSHDLTPEIMGTAPCSSDYVAGQSGVGSFPTITCDVSQLEAQNYSFYSVSRSVTITKKVLSVRYPEISVRYGSALPSLSQPVIDAAGFVGDDDSSVVSGTASCTSNYVVGAGVGSGKSVTCDTSGLSAHNYAFQPLGRIIDILPKTIRPAAPNVTVVYGSPITQTLTPRLIGFVGQDDWSDFDGTVTCSTTYVAGVDDVNSSATTTCDFSQVTNINYELDVPTDGSVTVTRRPLTIAAPSHTVELGVPFTLDPATFLGFAPGENESDLSGTGLVCVTDAPRDADTAGTYLVSCTGSDTETNYRFTFVDGLVTIRGTDPVVSDPPGAEPPVVTPPRVTPVAPPTPSQPSSSPSPNTAAAPLPSATDVFTGGVPLPLPRSTPLVFGQPLVTGGPIYTEQSIPTFDLGSRTGVGSIVNSRSALERTEEEIANENFAGLAPGSDVMFTVTGSRTVGNFVVTPTGALDPLALAAALTESTNRLADENSWLSASAAVSAPNREDLLSRNVTDDAVRQFQQSGLGEPRTVGALDYSAASSWLVVRGAVAGYEPGSVVYLAVTTSPVVLGAAVVDESGNAEFDGYLPVNLLENGGHSIRVIGTQLLGSATVGADGKIQMTPAVSEAVQRFDRGTDATIVLHGVNETGGIHEAMRIVPIDLPMPWWSVWIAMAGLLVAVGAKLFTRRWKFVVQVSACATVAALSLLPVAVGWFDAAWPVMIVGALMAVGGQVLLWLIPGRRRTAPHRSLPTQTRDPGDFRVKVPV